MHTGDGHLHQQTLHKLSTLLCHSHLTQRTLYEHYLWKKEHLMNSWWSINAERLHHFNYIALFQHNIKTFHFDIIKVRLTSSHFLHQKPDLCPTSAGGRTCRHPHYLQLTSSSILCKISYIKLKSCI